MPNRTALTTAVTSGAPAEEPGPARGDRIFGKVARPDERGPGARVQDVELFDIPPAPSPAPGEARPRGRHGAGKPRYARKAPRRAPRPERAAEASERGSRGGLSLPLLLTGALAAGIGLTVGLTSEPDRASPDAVTLTMPDLPAPDPTPDAAPSSALPTAKASPAPRAPSSAPAAPRTPPRTTAPPPSPTPPAPPAPPATHPATSTAPAPGPSRPGRTDSPLLSLGSTGPDVVDLQLRLQQLYLYLGSADGTFGTSLEVALSRFQMARDIPEEPGVYGPLTRAALYAETHRPGRGDRHDWDPWEDGDDWDF
ncbi:peptidoglycan-binding protein [Streptomyces sp. NPDC096079]|uniref:peptidoglycan-binding protein n=1 Tax=Streptomyces sp. NPDC096079 TaxID=3155820 RepID=UPI003330F954